MKRNDWLRTRKDKDGNILHRSLHAVREEPVTELAASKVRGGDGGARERRVWSIKRMWNSRNQDFCWQYGYVVISSLRCMTMEVSS